MDDKKLMEIAQEVDTMLATSAEKYGMPPLVYSSVILARLMVFNNPNQQGFKSLIALIANKDNESLQEDEYDDKEHLVH